MEWGDFSKMQLLFGDYNYDWAHAAAVTGALGYLTKTRRPFPYPLFGLFCP
jgi:hypothetical protein